MGMILTLWEKIMLRQLQHQIWFQSDLAIQVVPDYTRFLLWLCRERCFFKIKIRLILLNLICSFSSKTYRFGALRKKLKKQDYADQIKLMMFNFRKILKEDPKILKNTILFCAAINELKSDLIVLSNTLT